MTKDNSCEPEHTLILGLLKSFQCLQDELKAFREENHSKEVNLWNQCKRRFQEVEDYAEKLPEDLVDLIKTHVVRSRTYKITQKIDGGIFL